MRPRVLYLRLFAIVGLMVLNLPTAATAQPDAYDLERMGWRILAFPGIAETRFAGRPDGSIEVRAMDSSALLYRAVAPAERRGHFLNWRWRVDKPLPPTDLAAKGEDDRAIALHVWFPKDNEPTGLLRSLYDGVISAIAGIPLPGKVLTYVWGGSGQRGDRFANPYAGPDGMMIILRSSDAPVGRWFSESVDFAADFERAFGYPAPAPSHVAISGDADDTDGMSQALITDITFDDG